MGWRAWALWSLLSALGWLGLRPLRWLGAGLGHLLHWLPNPIARTVSQNQALVAPALPVARDRGFRRAALVELGQQLAEVPFVWTRSRTQVLASIKSTVGAELVEALRAEGRPTVFLAPHIGCWEVLSYALGSAVPLAVLYRPPRQAWLGPALERGRQRFGIRPLPATAGGLRAVLKHLHDGGWVGILPDQQPKAGEGEFAPFFGVDALTMVLVQRLVDRTQARVLMGAALRVEGGFRIHYQAPPEALQSPDPVRSIAALNAAVEDIVRLAPTQYQWAYKRFKLRPEGVPSRYPRTWP